MPPHRSSHPARIRTARGDHLRYVPRGAGKAAARPLIAFLLIASFGILFAGCGREEPAIRGPEDEGDFSFTEEDVARFRELAREEESILTGTGTAPGLDLTGGSELLPGKPPVLDLSSVSVYEAIRSGPAATGTNLYRVTNEFLNIRAAPNVTAVLLGRLEQGELVTLMEFVDAAWAKITLPPGMQSTGASREGYVSSRYVAKLVAEHKLAEEKKAFDGLFFVNFGFVNVRKEPDAQSEKLGELPGQAFVKPLSKDGAWARVPFQGKEGYVAMQYLSPFLPNMLVRQESFVLPILHYRLSQGEQVLDALATHVARLRQEGIKLMTFRDFTNLLVEQEKRDVRLEPKTALLAIADIGPENVKELNDVLQRENIRATLFLQTQYLGLSGITEKMILTLLANGQDLQSGGHTGDDLRSLTNAQVELELKQSRKILEDFTQKPVLALAYPQGGVNDRVMQKASEAGYLLGLGSVPERTFTRGQLLRLPSFTIGAGLNEEDVLSIVRAVSP